MRLNGWQRIGIVISVTWVLIGTFAYFDKIHHYPSWLEGTIPLSAYEWVQDNEYVPKQEESKDIIVYKPFFSMIGFLSFIFAPIVLGWMIVYLFLFIIRWVINGFNLR